MTYITHYYTYCVTDILMKVNTCDVTLKKPFYEKHFDEAPVVKKVAFSLLSQFRLLTIFCVIPHPRNILNHSTLACGLELL